ncbi:MAG: enoyl-CoA hydratase-related protein [Proteobacteria bacterium]|nr:enoyl-CoA hydratase-related protein [Pseudomonadota bacterium]
MFETILTDRQDGILTITLNRPERLNAWTYQMGAEMAEAVEAANNDDEINAIVVTGAGRGFCAGADIEAVFKAQADGATTATGRNDPRDWVGLVRRSKPMVAAINGAAVGIGLTQVLPMDYLIAANDAKLSVRFVKMGLVPELASSHFLTHRLGFGQASELMLTGKTITGDQALEIGLVDKVTSAGDLLAEARSVASAMGENPQSALRMIKQLLTQNISETDLSEVQKREGDALKECYASPEHKEAISAFLEKRAPDFKGARKN